MAYLRNSWYVGAWADEIAPEALFHRTLLEEPVLFFRNTQGELKAISDRCSHRFAPLHMGTHCGDSVACAYHGLRYDASGKCVHNPHQDGAIPAAAKVKAYPLVERHRIAWVWMGDPALADPSRIPDFSFADDLVPTQMSKGYTLARSNYQLLSDNIMDLSHVDFLHPTTLGANELSKVKATFADKGDDVQICWWSPNSKAFPGFAAYLPDADALADQWTEVMWHAPGYMRLENGATTAGRPRDEGVNTTNLHLMTPESETSTHYFFLNSRDFDVANGPLNDMAAQMLAGVFTNEDKPMVEAQQRYMGTTDLMAAKPVLLPIDAGAMRCRRVLQRLIEKENAVAAAAAKTEATVASTIPIRAVP
ncbi:aromatic ring-hydroxylating dioxygenase subunit alpha [Variovorax sp. J22P271]|uniref:aromatic ring-hydroxylating dioxygenase subunit alpha n=1 Tax=Variovorax davisae TaxID=3053515 RepID=UPI0025790D3A|nr:aromatic ring-hydroxylating dioxygenase subunit alpha [Variovorax sp. J22P271]MDM0032409.1 aromatic ring-hydroxylating dioxygenase subunit alpha [Variovorax sp. J22P271]